jgi:hypothetical protein
MFKIEKITKQVMTKYKRKPGRKEQGTLAGRPNQNLTNQATIEKPIDLKRTALGPAGLSQELSEIIEEAEAGVLESILKEIDQEGEPTSEPYVLEEIIDLKSSTLKLKMDTINIEDEYTDEIAFLKNYYSDIFTETIESILNLDFKTYDQIPHALLAIAMLYEFNFDDKSLFEDINITQKEYSNQSIDKMEVFMRTRTEEGTLSLLKEVFYNFELSASQEVTASYLIK